MLPFCFFLRATRSLFLLVAGRTLFVASKHVHPSEIPIAYRYPSLAPRRGSRNHSSPAAGAARHSFPVSWKTCDQSQPCHVADMHVLPVPKEKDTCVQLTYIDCLEISAIGRYQAEIPTESRTVALFMWNDSMPSVITPEKRRRV